MPAVFPPALIALCDLHRSETASEAFDLAIAAAVHVRSRIWFGDLLGAFVGVGIVAGHHRTLATDCPAYRDGLTTPLYGARFPVLPSLFLT